MREARDSRPSWRSEAGRATRHTPTRSTPRPAHHRRSVRPVRTPSSRNRPGTAGAEPCPVSHPGAQARCPERTTHPSAVDTEPQPATAGRSGTRSVRAQQAARTVRSRLRSERQRCAPRHQPDGSAAIRHRRRRAPADRLLHRYPCGPPPQHPPTSEYLIQRQPRPPPSSPGNGSIRLPRQRRKAHSWPRGAMGGSPPSDHRPKSRFPSSTNRPAVGSDLIIGAVRSRARPHA
jgi:hypothetical protein